MLFLFLSYFWVLDVVFSEIYFSEEFREVLRNDCKNSSLLSVAYMFY